MKQGLQLSRRKAIFRKSPNLPPKFENLPLKLNISCYRMFFSRLESDILPPCDQTVIEIFIMFLSTVHSYNPSPRQHPRPPLSCKETVMFHEEATKMYNMEHTESTPNYAHCAAAFNT